MCATESLVEMQILIQEFADIKSEAHESYEVGTIVDCRMTRLRKVYLMHDSLLSP